MLFLLSNKQDGYGTGHHSRSHNTVCHRINKCRVLDLSSSNEAGKSFCSCHYDLVSFITFFLRRNCLLWFYCSAKTSLIMGSKCLSYKTLNKRDGLEMQSSNYNLGGAKRYYSILKIIRSSRFSLYSVLSANFLYFSRALVRVLIAAALIRLQFINSHCLGLMNSYIYITLTLVAYQSIITNVNAFCSSNLFGT